MPQRHKKVSLRLQVYPREVEHAMQALPCQRGPVSRLQASQPHRPAGTQDGRLSEKGTDSLGRLAAGRRQAYEL